MKWGHILKIGISEVWGNVDEKKVEIPQKRIGDEALKKIKGGYLSGSTRKTRRDTERHLKISIEGQGMK